MAAFTVDVGLSTLSFNMPEAKGATIRVAGRFSPVPSRIDCANLRTIHIQNNALKWVGKLVLINLHNLEPITVDKFSLMKAGIYFSGLWLEASFTVDDENQVFAVRRADNRKWKFIALLLHQRLQNKDHFAGKDENGSFLQAYGTLL